MEELGENVSESTFESVRGMSFSAIYRWGFTSNGTNDLPALRVYTSK